MTRRGRKTYWLDRRQNVILLIRIFAAISAALLLVDAFYGKEAALPWQAWFGFYGFFGFVGCTALVLVAKVLRKIVRRDEDYYDR